jgi:glycosyltransferase involved in cell wall biosynthesis
MNEDRRPPLALAVISLNEEARIGTCLESVKALVREIIVVDSGSTDNTVSIAEAAHARVINQPWLGYRDQKQKALESCTQPWVLMLDCDEALSPELRKSIEDFFENGDAKWFQGVSFNRRTRFLGRWIRHGDWYPDRQLRLILREHAAMAGGNTHERLEVNGRVKHLHGDLLHDSFPTLAAYLAKIHPYSAAFLEAQMEKGHHWSLIANLFRPLWRFFRAYILKLGFLDGFPGFWIAYATAFSVFYRYSLQYEHGIKSAECRRNKA